MVSAAEMVSLDPMVQWNLIVFLVTFETFDPSPNVLLVPEMDQYSDDLITPDYINGLDGPNWPDGLIEPDNLLGIETGNLIWHNSPSCTQWSEDPLVP